jgi:TolB protein
MGNYASLRGPIGLNRVYAEVPAGSLKLEPWLESIKGGRTFATNGPLLRFELGLKTPGGEVHLDKKQDVFFRAALGSIVPVDHLQIVCNGKVERELELSSDRTTAYVEGKVPLDSSGWCVLRAYSDKAEYPILDLYPYATTSPVYVNIAGAPLHNTEDAAYFVAWMDRLVSAVESSAAWNTAAEKQAVLAIFEEARQKYETIAKREQ